MASKESFLQAVQNGYAFKGESSLLGVGMLDGQVVEGAAVRLPLKTMNRHAAEIDLAMGWLEYFSKEKTIRLNSSSLIS